MSNLISKMKAKLFIRTGRGTGAKGVADSVGETNVRDRPSALPSRIATRTAISASFSSPTSRASPLPSQLTRSELAGSPRAPAGRKPTKEEQVALKEMAAKVPLLRGLSSTERSILVARFVRHQFKAGDMIVCEGERGDHFYLIFEGKVRVDTAGKMRAGAADGKSSGLGDGGSEKTEGKILDAGETFGEIALLHSDVRSATVTASTDCVCFAIARQSFRAIVQTNAMERRRVNMQLLDGCRLLVALKHYERAKLCDAMHIISYALGETVIKQGDASSAAFHILVSGEVGVYLADKPDECVRTIAPGDYFGEVALLSDGAPTATVRCATAVKCLTIDSETFLRLVGSAERLLEARTDRYAYDGSNSPLVRSGSMSRADSWGNLSGGAAAAPTWLRINPARTPVLSELGSGCTACVYMTHLTDAGGQHSVAMKAVTKQAISTDPKKFKQVVRETEALCKIRSPFVVHLEGKGQDEGCLYLAIELAEGGTVFEMLSSLWQAGRVLSLDAARFYCAEMVKAVQDVHRAGFIHRDIKPENILLDSQGHVLLSDFGFTKELARGESTFTFCGTPDYLAPEMVVNSGHGHGVDFWALGVLLYEMLCGVTPFQEDDDEMKMYSRIMFSSVWFPDEFDASAKDLIAKLLERDLTKRLGLMNEGIGDIKKHPFFEGIDWAAVGNRRLTPPYQPGPMTPLSPSQKAAKRPTLSDLVKVDTSLKYSEEHIAFFDSF